MESILIRENYLNKLIQSKDLNLIKVITGVRRSGKSTLLLEYKNYLLSQNIKEEDIIMKTYYENLIYIELLRRGYEVYIGQYNDKKIDFIAIKPNEKIYYQVSRSILDEKVEEREKRSLLAINDNYKKVILTMDHVKNKEIEGIEVINIIDFLLETTT